MAPAHAWQREMALGVGGTRQACACAGFCGVRVRSAQSVYRAPASLHDSPCGHHRDRPLPLPPCMMALVPGTPHPFTLSST